MHDRNEQALAIAKERARLAKFRQIDFKPASIGPFSDPEPFDLVIGRYVLTYETDPADLIRAAAHLTRPGGIVAFHALDVSTGVRSFPQVRLWQEVGERITIAEANIQIEWWPQVCAWTKT